MPRLNTTPPPPPPPYLDEHIVGQIMQHLTRPQRMQFALVCRAWARAAAKATAAAGVVVHGARLRALRSVSGWLRNWGFLQIRSLTVHAKWTDPLWRLQLPYSSLAALTSLDLRTLDFSLEQSWRWAGSTTGSEAQPALSPIPGLRQLRLSSCQLTMQDYEQLTNPASASGSLTSLALHLPRASHWRKPGSVWEEGLYGALQHVTAVVDLEVSGDHWSSVVESLHSSKQLQRLAFVINDSGGDDDDGDDGLGIFTLTAAKYVPLPASMAGLTELVVRDLSAYSGDEGLWLRPVLLQALPQQQLPQLQRLELDDGEVCLAPSFLRLGCPNLVQLVLRSVRYAVDDVQHGERLSEHDPRLLLGSISSLQQLQHLELELDQEHFPGGYRFQSPVVTVRALPILLASKQLTELVVTITHPNCGPQHILSAPADQPSEAPQAPGLLMLGLNCEGTTPASLSCIPQHCPALQELVLHLTEGSDAAATAKDLSGLVGLASTLTQLQLHTCTEPDLASVAALSSLRVLGFHLQGNNGHLRKSSAQQLYALQNLKLLLLHIEAPCLGSPGPGESWPDDVFVEFYADPTAEPISMRSPVGEMLEWAEPLPGDTIGRQQ